MLVVSRKKNESIVIDNNIIVVVVEIRGDKVHLGIEAPPEVSVHRQEVHEILRRNEEKKEASLEVPADFPKETGGRDTIQDITSLASSESSALPEKEDTMVSVTEGAKEQQLQTDTQVLILCRLLHDRVAKGPGVSEEQLLRLDIPPLQLVDTLRLFLDAGWISHRIATQEGATPPGIFHLYRLSPETTVKICRGT